MKKPITAWILIFIGVMLLLNQFGLISFDRFSIAFIGSILIGVLLVAKSTNHPEKKGVLGGSFFLFFALTLLFMRIHLIPAQDQIGLSLIFVLLSLSNIIYFLFYPKKTANIIYALFFLLLSTPILLDYYRVLPGWMLEDYFFIYWPLLLILFGFGLLLEGLRKRKKKPIDFS